MKKRHSLILLSIAILAIVFGFCFIGVPQREVMYQGLTISNWLEKDDAATPLKALGTNLLPVYIDVLKKKERPLPLSERLRGRNSHKYSVLRGLSILNCQASPAMPYAFDLLTGSMEEVPDLRVIFEARELFLTLRCKDIMEQIIKELDSTNPKRRADAAFLLILYGRAATNAIPKLVKQMDSGEAAAALALTAIEPDLPGLPEGLVRIASGSNFNVASRHTSILGLSALGTKAGRMATKVRELLEISIDDSAIPQEVRPTFGNEKWRSSIVVALGNMGRAAAIAVPKLKTLLYDNDCGVRIFAARAVWQITEDPSLVVAVLKNVLTDGAVQPTFEFDWGCGIPDPLAWTYRTERSPAFYRTDELNCQEAAAYLLGEIGPEAKEAISVLEAAPVIEDTLFQLLLIRAKSRMSGNKPGFLNLLLGKLNSKVGLKPICVPAAYFLGELGIDAELAIPQLEELATDKNPAISTTAEHALKRIRRAIVERGER